MLRRNTEVMTMSQYKIQRTPQALLAAIKKQSLWVVSIPAPQCVLDMAAKHGVDLEPVSHMEFRTRAAAIKWRNDMPGAWMTEIKHAELHAALAVRS